MFSGVLAVGCRFNLGLAGQKRPEIQYGVRISHLLDKKNALNS